MKKLTARQLLKKFPDLVLNEGVLEDIACPRCGQRDHFSIDIKTFADVTDDGSDGNCGDHDWDDKSHCRCDRRGGNCGHDGKVRDFTFPGLDGLIAEQREQSLLHGDPH